MSVKNVEIIDNIIAKINKINNIKTVLVDIWWKNIQRDKDFDLNADVVKKLKIEVKLLNDFLKEIRANG